MRVIEVKSCRECPYWEWRYKGDSRVCFKVLPSRDIDRRTKTFPKFCPLKEAKDG